MSAPVVNKSNQQQFVVRDMVDKGIMFVNNAFSITK